MGNHPLWSTWSGFELPDDVDKSEVGLKWAQDFVERREVLFCRSPRHHTWSPSYAPAESTTVMGREAGIGACQQLGHVIGQQQAH